MQIQFIGHSLVTASFPLDLGKARRNIEKVQKSAKPAPAKSEVQVTSETVDLDDPQSLGSFLFVSL